MIRYLRLVAIGVAVLCILMYVNGHAARADYKNRQPIVIEVESVLTIPDRVSRYIVSYSAYNPNPFVVYIPIGENNRFERESPDQGQPTAFPPGKTYGIFERVVIMEYNGMCWTHPTWWQVDGTWAFAQGDRSACYRFRPTK